MTKLSEFLLAKTERWVLLLAILLLLLFALLLAGLTRYFATGGARLSALSPYVESIADFPLNVYRVLRPTSAMLLSSESRFLGVAGFQAHGATAQSDASPFPYLLLNRYDGDRQGSISELWNTETGTMVHEWQFESIDEAWQNSSLHSVTDFRVHSSAARFRNLHSLLQADGSLLTHSISPLLTVTACSRVALMQDSAIYHHSIETDAEGYIWAPSHLEPKTVEIGSRRFLDDAINRLSPEGEVVFSKSVIAVLAENQLGHLIYGVGHAPNDDPIHLNDIEPVLTDGLFWQAGDVFLSLRNQSMVLLYRPQTNQVIWHRQGPWVHQHDVNIINDHQISVFNNNAYSIGTAQYEVRGSNELMVYDFETQSVTSPWKPAFEKLEIRTTTQGRGTPIGEEVMVEETNYGRVLQFDKTGNVRWQYVNRASDGKVYTLNWSRLVSRELGNKVSEIVKNRKCS